MLPGHTLASVNDRPDGTKKAKDRVTINACANASGTIKLPLLLIRKAKNPRCFRNLNKEALPVVYRSQKNAWVDRDIFRDWFFNCFVPETKQRLSELGQEKKAILFLTIALLILVRANLYQLMEKSLQSFCLQTLLTRTTNGSRCT